MSWQPRDGSAWAELDERSVALACERVTVGLGPAEEHELAQRVDEEALFELELAAARLSLAGLDELALPPASLPRKLSATARDSARELSERAAPSPDRGALLAPLAFAGWLAAALVVLIAVRSQAPHQLPLDVA